MPKITALYAFIAEDNGPEDEGIMAFKMADGGWMPMVGADMARVDSLRQLAEQISVTTGKPYKLCKFKLEGEITMFGAKEGTWTVHSDTDPRWNKSGRGFGLVTAGGPQEMHDWIEECRKNYGEPPEDATMGFIKD